jgi:S1-C subfamily serine protease
MKVRTHLVLSLSVFVFSVVTLVAALTIRGEPVRARDQIDRASRSADEQRTIDVYKSVNEAVVFVTTITLEYDPFEFFMEYQPREGTGSGVIVDARRGIVLTNNHVIGNAHRIEVTLADGKNYKASLVGSDPETDIGVIQIVAPPPNLSSVTFGDSTALEIGQSVLAIGNPFGLSRTLTQGIVSSLDRTVKSPTGSILRGLIQTDAAINPGNSGGPLLDADGRLIGINTAILSQSGDSAGIGFAIPIDGIRKVLPELIRTGKIARPAMGWALVDTNQGPMVFRTQAGGPSDQAGLVAIERRVGNEFLRGVIRDTNGADLIVSINEQPVSDRAQVEDLIKQNSPADKPIRLIVRQGSKRGREREVIVRPLVR